MDFPHGLRGADLILSHHGGYIIAVIPDMPGQEMAVADILVSRIHGPGMAGGREGMRRHVKAGKHPEDAWHLQRLGDIHRADQSMRNFSMADFSRKGIPAAQVVHIPGPAGYFVIGVYTGNTFSDNHNKMHLRGERFQKKTI